METVADRIKELRIENGLSQTELAVKAGYKDKSSISKLEHSGDDITIKQIKKLAPALNTTAKYLMGWTQEAQNVIDRISDNISALKSEKVHDVFMEEHGRDPVFMNHIRLLWSLPDDRREAVYQHIEGLYYMTDAEQKEKDGKLNA